MVNRNRKRTIDDLEKINNNNNNNNNSNSNMDNNIQNNYNHHDSIKENIEEIVYRDKAKDIESRRERETSNRYKILARKGRNAKALCDSGLSTPSGNSNFSSLFSLTGCRGVSGHEIGFDFTKSDVLLGNKTQDMINRMVRSEEGNLYKGPKHHCIGMVTFNQAYMNSPVSVLRCTSCNRSDFDDRASNMGLSSSYEMPSEAFIKSEQLEIKSREKERYWNEEKREGIFIPKLESASPIGSRYYVAKKRDQGSKEKDIIEVGDPMCKTGNCFGLTYLGSEKIDPLSFILREPSDPTKIRTVRYSVSKLLRRKLPKLLEERYGKKNTELGQTENEIWLNNMHGFTFCSFERTRKALFKNVGNIDQNAKLYLKRRISEQLFRMYHGILIYIRCSCVSNEGNPFEKPFRLEYNTENYIYEHMDEETKDKIIYYCERNGLDKYDVTSEKKPICRLSAWRFRNGNIQKDEENQFDACESFDIFKGGDRENTAYEVDPDEWRGPWYRNSQSMDEDELVFYNLNPIYLIEILEFLKKDIEETPKMNDDDDYYYSYDKYYKMKEHTVLCCMLLRFYISNDIMHSLSPTRDRMLRLLLQLFVDQHLDLYSFFVSSGIKNLIIEDKDILLSRAERDEITRVQRGEDMEEPYCERDGPFWWKKRKQAFRNEWKKRVRDDPESLVRLYDKLYPHGRRFFSSTELPDLVHLFPFTDIWNKYRPMTDAVSCLINHIIFCKTQAHRCLIRSIATVLTQHKNESVSLISLIVDIIAIHLMGNYTGATHRPCLRSRSLIRVQIMELYTRSQSEIIDWIDQNQHIVYIFFREFMYDQMARSGTLRGIMLETSWQIENEMHCKFSCDMSRVVLSDRIRFYPSSLEDYLIENLEDIYRAKDFDKDNEKEMNDQMEKKEGEENNEGNISGIFLQSNRWCIQYSETRDMMIPHLMRGYRKRLHQMKIEKNEADDIIVSMRNKDIFALIDSMNEETLTKCREFQTKLSKGHFWECMQKDLGKFISVNCPYVLDLKAYELLRDINEEKYLFSTKKDPTGEKGLKEAKKKIIQTIISKISCYKSDMFSTTESDGILTGNHIRTIKMVAKHAYRISKGKQIDLSWLIILGVSYGTLSYLNFLLYAYLYHGLPDNRIKMDMPFILNRQYKKSQKISKKDLKNLSKYKQKKYEKEKYRTEGCYDIGVEFEPWMDECCVKWDYPNNDPRKRNEKNKESDTAYFFTISSHDTEGSPHIIQEEEKTLEKKKWHKMVKESLCHKKKQMGFYDDDDMEYKESFIPIDIESRHQRIRKVLGRDVTVGERDIAIIYMFFHFYRHSNYMQSVSLSREVKQQQTKALKCRMGIRQMDITPDDLGIMRYCGCGKWTESIVSSPEMISNIYAKGEYGAAFDLISNIKRCQDARTRFCNRKLNEIDMIGKAVRIGKHWYVVCVICGIITTWRKESYCDLGPTCGCHTCPMRPCTKYPMSIVALSSKEDTNLHRNLLNQGQLMNGYIHCVYCKDYIVPGKAVAIKVWTDDDGRSKYSLGDKYVNKKKEEEDDKSEGEKNVEWHQREKLFQKTFIKYNRLNEICDPIESGLQKTAKPKKYRLGTVYMCSDHMKHIAWKLKRDKVPTKNNLRTDISKECQKKMKKRMSSRYIKGK